MPQRTNASWLTRIVAVCAPIVLCAWLGSILLLVYSVPTSTSLRVAEHQKSPLRTDHTRDTRVHRFAANVLQEAVRLKTEPTRARLTLAVMNEDSADALYAQPQLTSLGDGNGLGQVARPMPEQNIGAATIAELIRATTPRNVIAQTSNGPVQLAVVTRPSQNGIGLHSKHLQRVQADSSDQSQNRSWFDRANETYRQRIMPQLRQGEGSTAGSPGTRAPAANQAQSFVGDRANSGAAGWYGQFQEWLGRAHKNYSKEIVPRLSGDDLQQPGGVAERPATQKPTEDPAEARRREAEAARLADQERREAERSRQAEAERQKRLADERRRAQERNAKLLAEEQKRAEERRRLQEQAQALKRAEEERQAAERVRLARLKAQQEQDRRTAEAKERAEKERLAKEAEAARLAAAREQLRAQKERTRQAEAEAEERRKRVLAQRREQEEALKRAQELRARAEQERRLAEAEARRRVEEAREIAKRQRLATSATGRVQTPTKKAKSAAAVAQAPRARTKTKRVPRWRSASAGSPKSRRKKRRRRSVTVRKRARRSRILAYRRRAARRTQRLRRCRARAGRRIRPPGIYVVRRGDTLTRIARRHYRNRRMYRWIYRANRRKIRNMNKIYPCQRIYLPPRRRS